MCGERFETLVYMENLVITLFLLAVRVDWLREDKAFQSYDDHGLLRQFQATKDPAWLVGFMARHQSLIIIRTLSFLKDESETEDFIGALFLKLRNTLQNGQEITAPKAWLRRLITNTLIDQSRRKSLHDTFVQQSETTDPGTLPQSVLGMDAEVLSHVIETLRPLPKMYVIKHFFQGKSNKEIAAEMELEMNQVRGARDRALKALREKLSADFGDYFSS